jgi:thiol-disulfide isomerase/thioredoxin
VLTRRTALLTAGVVGVAGLAGMLTARLVNDPGRRLAAVERAPADFTLPDPDGRVRRLSEWRGRHVLLNFWATWCPPCRHELPLLAASQKRYGTERLQVLGISLDDAKVLKTYLATSPTGFQTLVGDNEALPLMASYGHPRGSIPFSVLLGPDGKVLARKAGAFSQTELDALLKTYLPGPEKP